MNGSLDPTPETKVRFGIPPPSNIFATALFLCHNLTDRERILE